MWKSGEARVFRTIAASVVGGIAVMLRILAFSPDLARGSPDANDVLTAAWIPPLIMCTPYPTEEP